MADRVLYKDLLPYDTPSTLDALRGPAGGLLDLPIVVHCGPRRSVDLAGPGQRRAAYQAIVREGSTEMQEALLNCTLLHDIWAELMLPDRCRAVWEQRFPELAG